MAHPNKESMFLFIDLYCAQDGPILIIYYDTNELIEHLDGHLITPSFKKVSIKSAPWVTLVVFIFTKQ